MSVYYIFGALDYAAEILCSEINELPHIHTYPSP